MAETMAEGLVVEDAEGRFTFVNLRMQTILGYAPEELIGQHWSKIVSAEDRGRVARESAQRPTGITGVYETKLLAKDGREVPVLVSAAPLERNRQFAGTVVTFADISESKRTEAAEREQRALAEALRDSTAALSGTLNLDEVLDRVIANAGRVVPHDAADIMLIESGVSRVVRCRGYAERGLEGWLLAQRFPVADFPDRRWMIETSRPIAILDTRADAGWQVIPETRWVRSFVAAPIRLRSQVIGFLNLASETPGFFKPDHAERLLTFANQVALAIENARLYASAQQNAAETTALYRASAQLLNPAEDVSALAEEIVQAVTREFALADCGVLLVDEAQTELKRVARTGSFAVTATAALPLDGPGLTVWAARSGQTVYAPDVAADPRYIPNNSGTRSELAIPLRAGGRVVGVLDLQSAELDAFDERARRIVAAFAEHAGFALDNLQLREKLRQQSIRDPLTGLFNRRYLVETLEREVQRAARHRRPLGIVMLDLDHFKQFNDTFGHDAGDAVLRELSVFLQFHIRREDIACRYGGEEFTLILPDAALEVTRTRAEHIREDIKDLPVHYHNQPLGKLTLSLGVAEFPTHGPTGEAVMRAADAALYRAKHEGRDRVMVAEQSQKSEVGSRKPELQGQ